MWLGSVRVCSRAVRAFKVPAPSRNRRWKVGVPAGPRSVIESGFKPSTEIATTWSIADPAGRLGVDVGLVVPGGPVDGPAAVDSDELGDGSLDPLPESLGAVSVGRAETGEALGTAVDPGSVMTRDGVD